MPEPVPDLFGYLLGDWTCARELVERAAPAPLHGTYRGTARFSPASTAPETGETPRVLVHAERGELHWQGAAHPTSRTLLMTELPDGSAQVSFEDGRPFHILDLRTGTWTAHHPCAADEYTGVFEVLDADHWRLRWSVRGPAKDTTLTSHYTRVPGHRA